VEGRARFPVFVVGDEVVTLSPAVALAPGEQLALRVTYREGSPASVVFLLSGQPGAADGVVNVRRPQHTFEACRVELSATRERCEAQAKELDTLKARPAALSPAAVALSGFVNMHGMRGVELEKACHKAHGGELRPVVCWGLGGTTWSVVVLEVSNTGGEPWAPAWAEVTPAEGETRRARALLSGQATLPPGGVVSVAVEVEMPKREKFQDWLSVPHTVRVCNGDGSRCLSVPEVRL
jgi:uncharacterized protein (TIGR02268 family)